MEADTISKNGASSKSHTSRGFFLKMTQKHSIAFTVLVICLILSACSSSSPEKDGVKVAQMMCDCFDAQVVNEKNAYEAYIKNFGSYSFVTRIEAREKLSEVLQKAREDSQECFNKAGAYGTELESKYLTYEENIEKFRYAFNAHRNAFSPKEVVRESDYSDRINSLVQTIIPPTPDLEQLTKDLQSSNRHIYIYIKDTQKRINLATQLFYGFNGWKEIKILNTTENGDECLLLVYLNFVGGGPQYSSFDGNVNITYSLGTSDNWSMRRIETEK